MRGTEGLRDRKRADKSTARGRGGNADCTRQSRFATHSIWVGVVLWGLGEAAMITWHSRMLVAAGWLVLSACAAAAPPTAAEVRAWLSRLDSEEYSARE